jgi:hypothetical protein
MAAGECKELTNEWGSKCGRKVDYNDPTCKTSKAYQGSDDEYIPDDDSDSD